MSRLEDLIRTHRLEAEEPATLAEVAALAGVTRQRVHQVEAQILSGAPAPAPRERMAYGGLSVSEWAERLGVSPSALRARVRAVGWEVAVIAPRGKRGRPARPKAPPAPPRAPRAPRPKPAPRPPRPEPRRLFHDGRLLTITEWAAVTGLPKSTIDMRIARGLTPEQALTMPNDLPPPNRIHVYRGRSIPQWAVELGISNATMQHRVQVHGWAAAVKTKPGERLNGVLVEGRTLREWAAETGVSEPRMRQRLTAGWDPARAVREAPATPAQRWKGRKRK